MTAPLSRRRALSGAATLGVGAPLLAACGDDAETSAGDPAATPSSSQPAPSSGAPSTSATAAEPTAGAGGGLVATSDVPVGGGVVLQSEELVITQPAAGEFKAFTAICTHNRCLVTSVSDGQIACACHGSMFSVTDGSPTAGPAPSPLAEVDVRVSGDQVVRR